MQSNEKSLYHSSEGDHHRNQPLNAGYCDKIDEYLAELDRGISHGRKREAIA